MATELQVQTQEGELVEEEVGAEEPYMSDSELVGYCMEEVANAAGGGLDSGNEAEVSLPLDYYLGRRPGITKRAAKDPNSSRFVSMDMMDVVEATVSEIMPSFTTDEIAVYPPSGEGDEDQAALETTLVNYLFYEEYDGWILLQELTKDALINRNCAAKVFWDERAVVDYEEWKDMPAMGLHQALQPTEEEQQVEVLEQQVTGEQAAQPQSQQEMMLVQSGMMEQPREELFTVKVKRTTIKGKPKIESVAPEEIIVGGDHNSPYLYDSRFCGHEMITTVSSLIEQGYDPDIVENLPEYNANIESLSRSRGSEEFDYSSSHKSTKLVRIWELYPLIDFDGDGIAERRLVVIAEGNELLKNEPLTNPLIVGGVAMLMPHKYKGISMFDRVKQIQDAKTPMFRSIIDGTQLAANPRIGVVNGRANIDDVMRSRTGGIVRLKDANALVNVPNPEVPASAFTLIEMLNGQRSEAGGGAVSRTNDVQKSVGQGGDHSMERIMSSMELSNAVIARSLGETVIRGIFIQLHDIIRTQEKGEIAARIGGKWVKSMPSSWKPRTNVSVQIGSSNAERARRAGAMKEVIAAQAQLAAAGSVMYSEEKAYKAITDSIKLSGIKSPELYIVDPTSDEGKAAGQQKQQQDQEKKQQDLQMQIKMAEAQMTLAKAEQMKGQAALQSQQVKAENDRLTQELKRMEAIIKAGDMADSTKFDYDELYENSRIKVAELSLELTDLEQQYNKDLNAQVQQNQVG